MEERKRARLLTTCMLPILFGACQPTGVGDPCEPEVKLKEDEIFVETSSLQCRTRVCMSYNDQSFCTERCDTVEDCQASWYEDGPDEESPAYCEAEITVGTPEAVGTYCVPEWASTKAL